MELTIYNPQKKRLETLDVEFSAGNTTWFKDTGKVSDVSTITDHGGGLLIKKLAHDYPIWVYGLSRADIDYNRIKARQIMWQNE